MNIGFVGLGKMGSAMARSLMGAGHRLSVYNRTPERAEELGREGALVAGTPADAARDSEAIFTMLADDTAVSEVVLGKDGIAAGLARGATHISSSTISTALTRQLAEAHKAHDQELLSAPVFGRPDAAANKKLIVVAAGNEQVLQRFRPLFDAIGRRTFVIGPDAWQANAVKLSGNFMIASMLECFGETFALTRKSGINPHLFLDVMVELFGSPVYKNYGTVIADGRFEPAGFVLKLGLKDVRLALEAGQELNVPLPFGSILRDHFISAIAQGDGQIDWSAVSRVAARNAGLDS